MNRLLLITALVMTLPVGATDQANFPSTSGRAFNLYCLALDKPNPTPGDSLYLIMCLGYADGLVDGSRVHAEPPYCLPEDVDRKGVVRTILKYIEQHPTVIDERTVKIVRPALIETFPCSK